MPLSPALGPVSIRLAGEVIEPAKVTHNGDTAKVFLWDDDARRWRFHDTILGCEFIERRDHIELKGTSKTMVREMRIKPGDAVVSMEIRSKAFPQCS